MNLFRNILIWAVRLYRWTLSPAKTFLFGPLGQCRFTPSCSAYAMEALRTHGALAGTALAAKRICRCHPWGGSGPDPIPSKIESPALNAAPGFETPMNREHAHSGVRHSKLEIFPR